MSGAGRGFERRHKLALRSGVARLDSRPHQNHPRDVPKPKMTLIRAVAQRPPPRRTAGDSLAPAWCGAGMGRVRMSRVTTRHARAMSGATVATKFRARSGAHSGRFAQEIRRTENSSDELGTPVRDRKNTCHCPYHCDVDAERRRGNHHWSGVGQRVPAIKSP